MLMERNTLMEWVYPKIKEYCKEKHGLEFQVPIYYTFPWSLPLPINPALSLLMRIEGPFGVS